MIVRRASEDGHMLQMFQAQMHVALARQETEAIEIVHERYPPLVQAPLNSHPEMEQVYYIISGDGTAIVDGEQRSVTAGHLVYIPRGALHAVHSGERGLEYLCIDCFPDGYPSGESTWQQHEQVVRRQFGFPEVDEGTL